MSKNVANFKITAANMYIVYMCHFTNSFSTDPSAKRLITISFAVLQSTFTLVTAKQSCSSLTVSSASL